MCGALNSLMEEQENNYLNCLGLWTGDQLESTTQVSLKPF